MNFETRHVRYVFADVVRFSEDRTIEAQVEIVEMLNHVFREAVKGHETIFLPTGDGICAAILEASAPADVHVAVALSVLEGVYKWSLTVAPNRQSEVRIGINESVDTVVEDINGNRNIVGAGINETQRLMCMGDGGHVIAGSAVYRTLSMRDLYVQSFREVRAENKHGRFISGYQYIQQELAFLNIDLPDAVKNADPIEIELSERLEKEGRTTGGQVACTIEATDRWREEMATSLDVLNSNCNDELSKALAHSQKCWEDFFAAEVTFLNALRSATTGTIFRVVSAATRLEMVRLRVKSLRSYLTDWFDGFTPIKNRDTSSFEN